MAHEKVYCICENMCLEETMTKEQIEEKFSSNDNVKVVSGESTIDGSTTGVVTIPFPTGFNDENCVVISNGIRVIANKGFNYVGQNIDSSDSMNNAYGRRINLTTSGIVLHIVNSNTSSKTFSYKIALMKIPTTEE